MHTWIWIFLGGGLGCLCRHAIGTSLAELEGFPWGTFVANTIACLILGAILGYELKSGITPTAKLLLATGFCGGFSTFSTFSLETLKMIQSGQWLAVGSYVGGSIIVGIVAVYLGVKLVNQLV